MKRNSLALPFFSLLLLVFVTISPWRSSPVRTTSSRNVPHGEADHHVNPNTGNLTYHGGTVMSGTTNLYAIFWEPRSSSVSPTYNNLILRYFSDVGRSPLYQNNLQYANAHGASPRNAVLTSFWVDVAPYPSNPLYDSDIQNEVLHAQQINGWISSPHSIFFVFTAKGEATCSHYGCSFMVNCAYHDFFGAQPETIYADMPYAGFDLNRCGVTSSPNHDFNADSEISLISHEQMEAATDPLNNAWYNGGEIGDKCFAVYGPLNKYGGDVLWRGHPYMVQEEWDNAQSTCVLGRP